MTEEEAIDILSNRGVVISPLGDGMYDISGGSMSLGADRQISSGILDFRKIDLEELIDLATKSHEEMITAFPASTLPTLPIDLVTTGNDTNGTDDVALTPRDAFIKRMSHLFTTTITDDGKEEEIVNEAEKAALLAQYDALERQAVAQGWDLEGWGQSVELPVYYDPEYSMLKMDRLALNNIITYNTPEAPAGRAEIVRGEDVGGQPGTFFIRQPNGTLTPYIPPTVEEEEEEILTLEQQIAKFVGEGRIDEAMKLDQIRDQLNTERLTPERAAAMLVNVAYNPADFKQMMDAMLGRDSKLDPMTSDIRSLQEQAAAMLVGETQPVPAMPPMPPPGLIPARMPETALELSERVEKEGPFGRPYLPSEAQMFQEEGLEEFEPPPSPPIATFQTIPGRPTLIPAAESPMEEVTRVIPRGGLTEEEFAQLFTRADHPGSTRIPYVGGTPERRAALAPYIGAEYADLYDIVRRQQEAEVQRKKVLKGPRRVGYA